MNFTYTNFKIHRNGLAGGIGVANRTGRSTAQHLAPEHGSTVDQDQALAILKFDITPSDKIVIWGMNATDNYLEKGAVLYFSPVSDIQTRQRINILVAQDYDHETQELRANSYFGNNTSLGPASSVVVGGFTPWLWIKFSKVQLYNNWGRLTNDLYGETFKRIEFQSVHWGQYPPDQQRG
jgi:hypothetical protein